jgi:heat shock protein HtpX
LSPTITQSVLVYDRISQNQRKSVFLVALAILLTAPFVLAVSFAVSELALSQFGPHARLNANDESLRKAFSRRESGSLDAQAKRELDLQFAVQRQKMREERQKEQSAITGFRLEMMVVVAGGLSLLVGLLFWSVAASPTSKILTMCGARPAGTAESEAKCLLDNLAIGAGLPPPKLYIIDSPTPNAFAAGSDPNRSVIAVTQSLLLLLQPRELEAVLAHELSHIGNRDTRLNMIVTALALFLRLPYLLLKRKMDSYTQNHHEYIPIRQNRWYRIVIMLATVPALIYIFAIAPIIAALIRSAVSRGREFLADGDSVLLTRNPEALACALAKIGAAGSVMNASNPAISHLYFADPAPAGLARNFFRGDLFATHPSIDRRISRLRQIHAEISAAAIAVAVRDGAEFSRNHKAVQEGAASEAIKHDEISVLTGGNPMGRVFRVLSATAVYDQPDLTSFIVARVPAGGLLVVFDDPGRFRQVLTHDQTFGYMPASVKLQKVDLLPSEIHDPAARARAGAPASGGPALYTPEPAPGTPEIATVTVRFIEPMLGRGPDSSRAAVALDWRARRHSNSKLSGKHVVIAIVFGLAVFGGIFYVMIQYGAK